MNLPGIPWPRRWAWSQETALRESAATRQNSHHYEGCRRAIDRPGPPSLAHLGHIGHVCCMAVTARGQKEAEKAYSDVRRANRGASRPPTMCFRPRAYAENLSSGELKSCKSLASLCCQHSYNRPHMRQEKGSPKPPSVALRIDATWEDHLGSTQPTLANLQKARDRLVEDRQQLAADLAKSFKRGDEEKQALFTATQAAIEAIDRAIADEHAL